MHHFNSGRKTVAVALLSSGFSMAALAAEAGSPDTLSGKLVDRETGEPLQAAVVELWHCQNDAASLCNELNTSVLTDQDGRFRLSLDAQALAAGFYRVMVPLTLEYPNQPASPRAASGSSALTLSGLGDAAAGLARHQLLTMNLLVSRLPQQLAQTTP